MPHDHREGFDPLDVLYPAIGAIAKPLKFILWFTSKKGPPVAIFGTVLGDLRHTCCLSVLSLHLDIESTSARGGRSPHDHPNGDPNCDNSLKFQNQTSSCKSGSTSCGCKLPSTLPKASSLGGATSNHLSPHPRGPRISSAFQILTSRHPRVCTHQCNASGCVTHAERRDFAVLSISWIYIAEIALFTSRN
ncbi:hypothetical protein BD410DRAFT_797349 [Rickenella mellea]|uniref:Uncharacterized protein n=1 Tax=Rickenella mellea TaxID=50990 RepID=A0A4Y7PG90_9AGAM|nr:hypothetical protein BD410DRAFT_797349 [Rickenella mellea]